MMNDTASSERLQAAVRAYLRRVLNETGLSAGKLALRAGIAATTITRPLNDPKIQHTPSIRTLTKIANASGIALPLELGGGYATMPASGQESSDTQGDALNAPQTKLAIPLSGPRDLPIVGYAKGGMEAMFMDNGEAQGYAERPWFLLGNPGAYAVYVHDTSMTPALEHGQLLYVNPSRPVSRGDDCVIQMADGEAYVKRFVQRVGPDIICQQFNPAREIRYKRDNVVAVHLVVAVLKVRV